MSRLKGSKLEAEIMQARGDCNWRRMEELLPMCRAKNSQMEHLATFLYGELILEKFVDDESGRSDGLLAPSVNHVNRVSVARDTLDQVIVSRSTYKADVVLETHLLLAKLHYICAQYNDALSAVNNSQLERQDIQFHTIRTLRLVADAYAIKGLSLERLSAGHPPRQQQSGERQILYCFEKSAMLALSYIQELEKSAEMSSSTTGVLIAVPTSTVTQPVHIRSVDKIGEFLETAMQRVPLLQIKSGSDAEHIRSLDEGVEQYRQTLTGIGDKNVAQHLHQKMLRQLAEVLMRGVPDACYTPTSRSDAVKTKTGDLRLYNNSDTAHFTPHNRIEELLLALSISEALAARDAVLSRAQDATQARHQSLLSVNAVHNLLTITLVALRQYHLSAGLLEKAMKFAYEDRYIWKQFALALLAAGYVTRAALIMDEYLDEEKEAEDTALHSSLARRHDSVTHHVTSHELDIGMVLCAATNALENTQQFEYVIHLTDRLIGECEQATVLSRAHLLQGLAHSSLVNTVLQPGERVKRHERAVKSYRRAIDLDPHDHMAQMYLALQYALAGELSRAMEYCTCSLAMNCEQPYALILMALLLTCHENHAEALEIIREAQDDWPSHYGLQVVRFMLESHFGLTEEAVSTAQSLLEWFSRNTSTGAASVPPASTQSTASHPTVVYNSALNALSMDGDVRVQYTQTPHVMKNAESRQGGLGQRTGSSSFLSGTPALVVSHSTMDIHDGGESELGGGSTVSDSAVQGNMLTAGGTAAGRSTDSDTHKRVAQAWRIHANMWLSLADVLIDGGKVAEVTSCVEHAQRNFPNSHHALYLKGRLLMTHLTSQEVGTPSHTAMLNDAKACLLGALCIQPGHVPSMRQLTHVYQMQGNLRMAEKVLRDSLHLDGGQSPESWQRLGCVLAEQELYMESAECLETACRLSRHAPVMPFNVIPRQVHHL